MARDPRGLGPHRDRRDRDFIGPELSSDTEERKCQVKLGAEHGVRYTYGGWRTDRVPEPTFGPNYT